MTAPARWDRTIYRNTDHAWRFRRLDSEGAPIVPTAVEAYIKLNAGTEDTWATPAAEVGAEGWITVTLPAADTQGDDWDDRKDGVWAVHVTVAGKRYRWVQGKVTVAQ